MRPSTWRSLAEASSRADNRTEIVAASAIAFYYLNHFFPNLDLGWLQFTSVLVVLVTRTSEQSKFHNVADRCPVLVLDLTGQTSERFTDYSDGNIVWLPSVSKEMLSDFLEPFFLASADSPEPVAVISHINSSEDNPSNTSARL